MCGVTELVGVLVLLADKTAYFWQVASSVRGKKINEQEFNTCAYEIVNVTLILLHTYIIFITSL